MALGVIHMYQITRIVCEVGSFFANLFHANISCEIIRLQEVSDSKKDSRLLLIYHQSQPFMIGDTSPQKNTAERTVSLSCGSEKVASVTVPSSSVYGLRIWRDLDMRKQGNKGQVK